MKQETKEIYQEGIAKAYIEFLKEFHKDPTRKEFEGFLVLGENDEANGVTSWRSVFKSLSDIRAMALKLNEEAVKNAVFTEEELATDDYFEKRDEAIKQHRRFFVTTAVNGKPVNIEFLNSIKNYCEKNNALLLILPSHDVRSQKREFKWNFDPALKAGFVITEDTVLNENCMLSGITASAKQINPVSGLMKLPVKVGKSMVFPGTKQIMGHIATLRGELTPHMYCSTGAVTVADYSNDKIMSGRTSYIAEKDHTFGGFIIEIEDEKRFHFRVVQMAPDGSFNDLGVKYKPDGTTSSLNGIKFVLGDSHVGYHDKNLFANILDICKEHKGIDEIILHDIDNASSISHHEANNFIKRTLRALNGEDSLLDEINDINRYLNQLTEIPDVDITVVNSNHDRHIEKYIESGRFILDRDFKNIGISLELMKQYVTGELSNPVQYLSENIATVGLNNPSKIKWLKRDESYNKYGVELGMHGDEGANGAKGSMRTFAISVGNAVVAHAHTGAIFHNIFQVGTTSELNLGYNHGLSSWTRTCCFVYPDGTKQLVNFLRNVDGGYTYHA